MILPNHAFGREMLSFREMMINEVQQLLDLLSMLVIVDQFSWIEVYHEIHENLYTSKISMHTVIVL